MRMWLLWLTNRWRGVGAVVVTLLAIIAVALIALSRSDTGISLLGDASAARPIASGSSSVVLPRSGSLLISVLDTPLPPSDGVQTVAAAQASWSANEIAQHQEMVLAAINCARQQRGQDLLTLDSALSATSGDAWLKLVHDPSWSLMQLPGTYALRGVVSLDFAPSERLAAQTQQASADPSATESTCTVGSIDGSSFAASADTRTIGIAIFPPQTSWDAASAVVLVR